MKFYEKRIKIWIINTFLENSFLLFTDAFYSGKAAFTNNGPFPAQKIITGDTIGRKNKVKNIPKDILT